MLFMSAAQQRVMLRPPHSRCLNSRRLIVFQKRMFASAFVFYIKYVTNDNAAIYVGGNKIALRPQCFLNANNTAVMT